MRWSPYAACTITIRASVKTARIFTGMICVDAPHLVQDEFSVHDATWHTRTAANSENGAKIKEATGILSIGCTHDETLYLPGLQKFACDECPRLLEMAPRRCSHVERDVIYTFDADSAYCVDCQTQVGPHMPPIDLQCKHDHVTFDDVFGNCICDDCHLPVTVDAERERAAKQSARAASTARAFREGEAAGTQLKRSIRALSDKERRMHLFPVTTLIGKVDLWMNSKRGNDEEYQVCGRAA